MEAFRSVRSRNSPGGLFPAAFLNSQLIVCRTDWKCLQSFDLGIKTMEVVFSLVFYVPTLSRGIKQKT